MPRIEVTVSDDRLSAWLSLESGGETLDRAAILSAIDAAGVKHGLIDRALKEVREACVRSHELHVLIANGVAPKPPTASRLAMLVDSRQTSGRRLLDGRIDWRERNTVTNVRPRQAIALWHEPTRGEPGVGVDGQPIWPEGWDENFDAAIDVVGEGWTAESLGKGTHRLRATREGVLQVDVDAKTLSVLRVLSIEGDVGVGTGNIRARGAVIVHGSVLCGSSIETRGDLVISGAVDEADLRVGGSLEVGEGLVGIESRIEVEGEATFQHAQNVRLRVGGDIHVLGSCVDVRLDCGGFLHAVEGRGQLRGGTYDALNGARVKELGSESGALTQVRVGARPELFDELVQLEHALAEAERQAQKLRRRSGHEVRRLNSGMDRRDSALVRANMKRRREVLRREDSLAARIDELASQLAAEGSRLFVEVTQTAHSGTVIQILHLRRTIDEAIGPCRFLFDSRTRRIETIPLTDTDRRTA